MTWPNEGFLKFCLHLQNLGLLRLYLEYYYNILNVKINTLFVRFFASSHPTRGVTRFFAPSD